MNETINAILNTPFDVLLNEAAQILNSLHFIRAEWFYAFIPLILFLLLMRSRAQSDKNWHAVIDQALIPFVLTSSGYKRRTYPLLLIFIAASLCITALAGPVYKKLPQPVYREQSSLVILLDLSQSMNASDIKPSRLYRAKLELLDILKARKTGQTALIVYAAEAFVVTPLTDDNATIANLVPALETDMMPAQGSNLSAALAKAVSLFSQSGSINGDILVITDGIHQHDRAAIEKIRAQGFRLSIFGIGTTEGGPIPLQGSVEGGFLQDSNGAIVIPRLRPDKLQSYALAGGGLYTGLRADDSDTNKLSRLFQSSEVKQDIKNKETSADVWQEEGPWLLLPLLLLAAFWARKGWVAALLPFALSFIIALPQPAYAEGNEKIPGKSETAYLDIKHLWSSPDQKAMKAFNAGDNESAAREFTRPDWKASAYYRNGNYQAAASVLENPADSNGFYNKANALARLGKYQEAIKAYDRAIELDKNNDDARFNREQVKKAMQQQQQKQQQDNSGQQNPEQQKHQQDSKDQSQQNQQSQNQQQNRQQDNQSQQDQNSKDKNSKDQQQQQDNQSGEQSSAEKNKQADENKPADSSTDSQQQSEAQKQAEEKQLKQRDAEAEQKKEQQEKQQYEQQQKEQQQEQQQDKDNRQNSGQDSNEIENSDSKEKPAEIEVNPTESSITEDEKATEQWLKRIPDDPGGLLRRKFLYQYKQMPDQNDDEQPW
ncbi:MAG: VWA domain-containing protein [Gammaproteobacteria bacterium]|nr:VWA domain-containing protein [Gammaproteobacteria bacterium]